MNQFQQMPSAYMPVQQAYQPYQPQYQQMPARMVPQISGRVVNSLDDIERAFGAEDAVTDECDCCADFEE